MSASSMRAVQVVKAGEAFVVTNMPVPEPAAGQVRVKVHACGVCAGENIARLGLWGVQLPRVPGHEIAGVVDATGPGVQAWTTVLSTVGSSSARRLDFWFETEWPAGNHRRRSPAATSFPPICCCPTGARSPDGIAVTPATARRLWCSPC